MAAMEQLGYPEIRDLNNLGTNNGTQRWNRFVGSDGRRQDVAHRYLHPRLRDGAHPNLHVIVEAQIVRVLFNEDNTRAVGVEYRPNPQFQALSVGLTHTPVRAVRARRLVVLSCGACGTPSVLERSGVGDPEVLRRAGVPGVADLPGVGHDYQDHNLVLIPYRSSIGPGDTLDSWLSGRETAESLIEARDHRLGWNGIDAASKLRPSEAEVDALGPEFRAAWDRDFKDAPNRPLMLIAMLTTYVKLSLLFRAPYKDMLLILPQLPRGSCRRPTRTIHNVRNIYRLPLFPRSLGKSDSSSIPPILPGRLLTSPPMIP